MKEITLSSAAEKKAQEATTLSFCNGLNLLTIKQRVATLLNHIGDNGIFSEFTMHDISHVDGMLELLDKVIDDKTRTNLTKADWMMIVLACYFHDLGMFVSQDEYDNRLNNPDFCEFQQRMKADSKVHAYLVTLPQEKQDHFLYQEYVRRNHGERIYRILSDCKASDAEPFHSVNEILTQLNEDFRKDLAMVCRSHTQEELDEHLKVTDVAYGATKEEKVNLLYACVALRTADLLHVTYERTPNDEFRIISPKNEVSIIEWIKQQSVKSVDIHKECDEDGNVDMSIAPHSFEIQAKFTDETGYFSFMEYVNYSKAELKKCHKWCEESRKKNGTKYYFPWDNIDTSRIEAIGFCKKKLNFVIDQQNILKLLTGHTLYNDSTVVLRELLQNSIDAGKLQMATEKAKSKYENKIEIEWDPTARKLVIADNATGMTERDIQDYLLKVGSSKYQSETFKNTYPDFNSISRFGIGLLTCFMVSDNIDVYTLSAEDGKSLLLKIRNLNGEYLMRTDVDASHILGGKHGTTFELYIRPDVDMDDIVDQIKRWVILPTCSVTLKIIDGEESAISIGYGNISMALQQYASKEYDINFNDENYRIRVLNDKMRGVSLACLQKRNKFTKIWTPYVTSDGMEFSESAPVGICIEGIRVTQTIPGVDGHNMLVLVNCEGKNAPTTNVARDAIEEGPAYENMLRCVYEMLFEMFTEQREELLKSNSELWVNLELNYALGYFIGYRLRVDAKNRQIFNGSLSKIPTCLVDDACSLHLYNIDQLPDKICTIDSVSFSSALKFLQDLPAQKELKTPINILQNLIGKMYAEKPVLYDENMFDEALYKYREVFSPILIQLNHQERKISIEWQRGADTLYYFPIDTRYFSYNGSVPALYIQKNNDSLKIEDSANHKIICSNGKVFILRGCPIYDMFMKYIDQMEANQDAYANVLSFVWDKIQKGVETTMYDDAYMYDNMTSYDSEEALDLRYLTREFDVSLKESANYILDYSRYYHNKENID